MEMLLAIAYLIASVCTWGILITTVEAPLTKGKILIFLGFSLIWPILIVTYFLSGRN